MEKTKLKTALKAFVKLSAFETAESLFVIVDADRLLMTQRSLFLRYFRELRITAPKKHGDVVHHGDTKISFFIMPGNGEDGAIEDLVLKHASGKSFSYIEGLFYKIKEDEAVIAESDTEYKIPDE